MLNGRHSHLSLKQKQHSGSWEQWKTHKQARALQYHSELVFCKMQQQGQKKWVHVSSLVGDEVLILV